MNWIKKKTPEQKMQKRVDSVFAELIGTVEHDFTDLETIQILNNVRRKLSEHLEAKKDSFTEQSVISSQKAREILNALEYLE